MSFLFDVFIIYLIVSAIKAKSSKKRASRARNTNTTDAMEQKIIGNLRKYFATEKRMYIDEETYIVPDDYTNIQFGNLGIYIRDEYISSLTDYKLAFPNAYNSFLELIKEYLAHKKSQPAPAPAPQQHKAAESDNKDANYYIKRLNQLNVAIEEPNITAGLHETVDYLQQIGKIEAEFPSCKEKTGKLYQYYLPMLTDILENYKRLSGPAASQAEFKKTEDRLQKTIMLINGALKTIASTLCEDYYTDMSADMKTLEALLKKDGLAGNEMDINSFVNGGN